MLAYQLLTGRFPFWEDVRHETLTNVWKAILTQNFNWNAEVGKCRHVQSQFALSLSKWLGHQDDLVLVSMGC